MKNKNKEKKEMQAPVHELSRMRRVAERGKGSRLQEGLCIGYGGPWNTGTSPLYAYAELENWVKKDRERLIERKRSLLYCVNCSEGDKAGFNGTPPLISLFL